MTTVPSEAETPLAYRAVRGGLWVALSSYWTIGFGFVANILLTRLLAPEAFGTFALATFFAQLLRLQTKLGLGYAFGQYRETSGEAVGTYAVLDGVAAVGGLVLMVLAAPILRRLGYDILVVQAAIVLAFAALAEGVSSIAGTLLERELRFGPTSLYQGIIFPLSYIPAFWLATHGGGVWSLVAQTTTYSVLFLGLWWVARRNLPHVWQMKWRFRRDLARHFLRFGATIGLWFMAGMLFSQLDNFFIGTFVGVTMLGYYDRAYRMAQWPGLLFTSILSRSAFYTYARLQGDQPRLEKTASMVTWAITMAAIPLALAVFIAAADLVVLLYGQRWLPSVVFLQILIAFFVIRPLIENAGMLFGAIGKPTRAATLVWAEVGVVGVAGLPLTLKWGALGTCGAVGLALAVGVALAYRYVSQEVKLRLSSVLGLPLLAGGVVLALYFVALPLFPLDNLSALLRLALKAGYAFSAFYALVFLLQPRGTWERVRYVWRLARQESEA